MRMQMRLAEENKHMERIDIKRTPSKIEKSAEEKLLLSRKEL